MDILLIILIALIIDLAFGDPPTIVHPVGWMGKLITVLSRIVPGSNSRVQLVYGSMIVIISVGAVSVSTFFLLGWLSDISRLAYVLAGSLLLKSTFSVTGLRRSSVKVRNHILNRDMENARSEMGALVSRDASQLEESLVVVATVESVAENTSDSFVAPLFWFLILGIPGAVGYRMANTFDSMIGYRGEYEYLGKFAARFDDVLNYIPARITGLLITGTAAIYRTSARAWRIMIRDHSATQSPNAGWPMSAAAGALGVQLEKVGYYKLGDPSNAPSCATIDAMIRLMYAVVLTWSLICLAVEGVRFAITS